MMDWTGIVDYYPWNGILEIAIACCRNRGSEFSALKRKQFPRGLISVINALIWAKHLSSICWSFVGGGLSFSIYFVHIPMATLQPDVFLTNTCWYIHECMGPTFVFVRLPQNHTNWHKDWWQHVYRLGTEQSPLASIMPRVVAMLWGKYFLMR